DVGNDFVVHVPGLAGEDLGDGDAFILSLVGEHRPGDDVADGVDAVDVGAVAGVDLDAAALVSDDAAFGKAEAGRERPAADGDENDIGVDHFTGAGARRGRLD